MERTERSNMKKLDNPLDTLFDVMDDDQLPLPDVEMSAPGAEVIEYEQVTESELAELAQPGSAAAPTPDMLDADDIATNKKIDDVYDAALGTFQQQMAYTEIIEPRYAARNAEVAASYLNIALSAAGMKAKIKADRKRNMAFIPHGNKTTNNTIVATREEIMRMISIDADTKPV